MTARRRRKSGSGPSATALIAWVGGTGFGPDHQSGTYSAAPVRYESPAGGLLGGRALLGGRVRGLAAGTLLACGSVLAVTVHAADSSGAHHGQPTDLVTVEPGTVSGGYAAPAGSGSTAAPAVTSAQAAQPVGWSQLRAGAVVRNVPRDIDVPRPRPAQHESHAAPALSQMGSGGQGQQQGAVDGMVAPLAAPVTQVPATVVGVVGDVVTPRAQASSTPDSSAGSPVRQVAPATVGSAVRQVAPPVAPATSTSVEQTLTSLHAVIDAAVQDAQPAMSMLSPLPLG